MTIEEAIEHLRRQLATQVGRANLKAAIKLGDRKAESMQLGIEALERMQDARENPQGCTHWYRLPSEGEANES